MASSCKAKYVAAFEASKEAMWLHTPLNTIGYKPDKPIMIPCSNNTINLSENPLLHDQVKHIDIKHHFLQKCIQSQDIVLSYINTRNSIANIFMKALNTKDLLISKFPRHQISEDSMQGGVFTVRMRAVIIMAP